MFDKRNVLARTTSIIDYGRQPERRAHHTDLTGRRKEKAVTARIALRLPLTMPEFGCKSDVAIGYIIGQGSQIF
jgi:hypothetical protein